MTEANISGVTHYGQLLWMFETGMVHFNVLYLTPETLHFINDARFNSLTNRVLRKGREGTEKYLTNGGDSMCIILRG